MEDKITRKVLLTEEVSLSKEGTESEIKCAKENENKEERALHVISASNTMSSKFAEVGRSIILALVAGSWILLYYYKDKNPGSAVFIKYALVFAFIYLLIDLFYYCITMIVYHRFVNFDTDNETLSIKDDHKTFKTQAKIQRRFMFLSVIKLLILFAAVIFVCVFIYLN